MPHWYGGLSGGHAVAAGHEVRTCLQTRLCEFQTHEAELHLTARTDNVLAARFVVLHLLATGGAEPYGGTSVGPNHLREGGGHAVLDDLEIMVNAAVVVAAVRAWGRAFPGVHALPAEVEQILLVRCADQAHNVEVV